VDLAETVSRAMVSRDPYTATHQRNVAELSRLVGQKMGLDEDRLKGLYMVDCSMISGRYQSPKAFLTSPDSLRRKSGIWFVLMQKEDMKY